MLALRIPRVLICGSRHWPWPETINAVLERLHGQYGDALVLIEGGDGCTSRPGTGAHRGRQRGADHVVHQWCEARSLPAGRHRCHPVDWEAEQRTGRSDWRMAGPRRNTRMLLEERPQLVIAFHDDFSPAVGGTSDMCLRGVLQNVPVWLVPGSNPHVGSWLAQGKFPTSRTVRVRRELILEGAAPGRPPSAEPGL